MPRRVPLLLALLLATPVRAGDDVTTTVTPGFNAVWADGAGNAWAVGDFGFVAETVDRGQTWHALVSPTKESLLAVWRAPQGTLFVAGKEGTILHRDRAGRRWTPLRVHRKLLARLEYNRASFEFRGVAGNDREIYLIGGDPRGAGASCLRARRGATLLDTTFPCEVDNPFGVWVHGRDLFVHGGVFDCHGGDYSALDQSTDGGRHFTRLPPTWSEAPPPLWLTAGGATFALDPDGTVTRQQDGLHADRPTTKFKTGRTFEHRGIWADDQGEIYIVGAGYVVLHSRDGGKTFDEIRVDATATPR